jgi:hypothetical protein
MDTNTEKRLIIRHLEGLVEYYTQMERLTKDPKIQYKLTNYYATLDKFRKPDSTIYEVMKSVGTKMRKHIHFALDPYSVEGDEADWAVRKGDIKVSVPEVIGIPRSEAEQIIEQVSQAIYDTDIKFNIIAVGSYRRGNAYINDIDILIYPTGKNVVIDNYRPVFRQILESLEVEDSDVKSMGKSQMIFMYDGNQVDIFTTTKKEYPYALLHYSGSREFIIRLTGEAKKNGYHLSVHGLFKNDKLIELTTERAIFKELGEPYRKPEER